MPLTLSSVTAAASPAALVSAAAPAWLDALRGMVGGLEQGAQSLVAPATVHVVLVEEAGEGDATLELDIPADGTLTDEQNHQLSHFLRCKKTGRTRKMNRGLVVLIHDVAEQYPGHAIEVTSAYRGTREERRTSPHLAGRALDFRVRGVKATEVRDWLWRTHHEIGLGFYPHHDFLHMDTRPGQHDTSWTQKHMNEDNIYNPRWAYLARK
jgi:uncharacterized protein YcbK (DUF882 family)